MFSTEQEAKEYHQQYLANKEETIGRLQIMYGIVVEHYLPPKPTSTLFDRVKEFEPALFNNILFYLGEVFQLEATKNLSRVGIISVLQYNQHWHKCCEEFEEQQLPIALGVDFGMIYKIISTAREKTYAINIGCLSLKDVLFHLVMEIKWKNAAVVGNSYTYETECAKCLIHRHIRENIVSDDILVIPGRLPGKCLSCRQYIRVYQTIGTFYDEEVQIATVTYMAKHLSYYLGEWDEKGKHIGCKRSVFEQPFTSTEKLILKCLRGVGISSVDK